MRLCVVLAASAAILLTSDVRGQASGASRGGVAPPTAARVDTGWSSARIDRAKRLEADSIRGAILASATWAGFAKGPCAPGDLRTFERDSVGNVPKLLARLEQIVLNYGAYVSLDNPIGRALLRAVVRLETGGPAPRWDVLTGTAPRVFNPVLPASLYNSETQKCVMTPGVIPDGLVLPDVKTFVVPRDSGAPDFAVSFGPHGLNRLRDLFHARNRTDSAAVFHNTRVVAHGLWQDYAIIGVQRDAENLRGGLQAQSSTGAVYAFRRVGSEWRVLGLVRNW